MIKLPQMFVFHEKDLGVGKLKCLICPFLELLVLSKDFVCVGVCVQKNIVLCFNNSWLPLVIGICVFTW